MFQPQQPIFLVGMPASGKSKLGKGLAKTFKIPFIDLDTFIENNTGESIASLFNNLGEDQFRILEKECLEKLVRLQTIPIYICATGGGTPCFFSNIDFLLQSGIVVYLNISEEKLLKRLIDAGNKHRPQWQNMSEIDIKNLIHSLFLRRKTYYCKAQIISVVVDNYTKDLQNLISLIVSY